MNKDILNIKSNLLNISRFFALMLAFGIPWSNAFFNFGFYLMIIFFSFSLFNYQNWKEIAKTPVVIIALVLFIFILIKTFFSSAPWELARHDLINYRKLIAIPFLVVLFRSYSQKMLLIISYCFGAFILMLPTLLDGFGFVNLIEHITLIPRNAAYSLSLHNLPNLVYWRNQIVHGFHVSILLASSVLGSIYFVKYRFALLLVAALCVYDLLFFIYGRMALLSLFFTLITIFFMHTRTKKNIFILATAIMITLSSFYYIVPSVNIRLTSITDEASHYFKNNDIYSSSGQRLHYWNISWNMFKESPITGMGSGSFRYQLITIKDPLVINEAGHTHNEYLTQLSQYGLIGFILFSSLLVIAFRNSRKIHHPWLANVTSTAIIIFALNCLTDSSLHNDWEGWTFVLIVSIACSNIKIKTNN